MGAWEGMVEWFNLNQGFSQAVLAALLVLVSVQLVVMEVDRGRAIFKLRFAFGRDTYDNDAKIAKVMFALANIGGMASPPDSTRCYVLIARGKHFFGILTRWEKCGLEIFTQHHFLQIESGQKGWKGTIWDNIGEKDKDTTLAPGQINAYVARFHPTKPLVGPHTAGRLCIGPVKGRRRMMKVWLT